MKSDVEDKLIEASEIERRGEIRNKEVGTLYNLMLMIN
jgi:hypothetical protein